MNQKQMAKKIKLALLSCLIIFSFITEKVNLVYADTTTSIDIIYEQKFVDKGGHTDTTVNQEFIYELVASASGNPMPAGSVGGVYETTLKGNVGGSTTIVFDKAGVFEYILKASAKNDLRGFIPASVMSYRIEITVLKKMSGELDPFIFAFNADGEKVVDPPFVYTVQDAYSVKYGFQSGTPGMDLPQAVKDLLPNTETGKFDGDVVGPSAYPPIGTTIKADGGVWTFVGWDSDSQTIDGGDAMFVGKWVFATNPTPTTTPTPTGKITTPTPTGKAITSTPRPTRKPVTNPKKSGTTGKGGGSKTGDTTKIYTLVALAVASTGVIILAIAKRRKKDEA